MAHFCGDVERWQIRTHTSVIKGPGQELRAHSRYSITTLHICRLLVCHPTNSLCHSYRKLTSLRVVDGRVLVCNVDDDTDDDLKKQCDTYQ